MSIPHACAGSSKELDCPPMAFSFQNPLVTSENGIRIPCGTVQGTVYDDRFDVMLALAGVPVTGSFNTSCLYFYENLTRRF